ncbi:MAG: S49 family peptidase [Burkholderiaceae bacterium]
MPDGMRDGYAMRGLRRAVIRAIGGTLAYSVDAAPIGAAVVERLVRGARVSDAELLGAFTRSDPGPSNTAGKHVAVLPMRGLAMYDTDTRASYSAVRVARDIARLANDPTVGTIVLDIDSPGGMVAGTPELGNAVFAARQRKSVVAIVNPLCASAAYWVAAQASNIVAVPSAEVGSIGVFMAHTDCSKFNEMNGFKVTYIYAGEFKVEGNSDEPLGDSAREHFQTEVDAFGRDFHTAVARGRGTTVANVAENFGKGRCMLAPAAKRAGLIDAIASSPDEAFALAVSPSSLRKARLAALTAAPPPPASDDASARRARLQEFRRS